MKQILLTAITCFVFVSGASAQAPKPFLHGPVSEGVSAVEGNFNPLASGTAPLLDLLVDGRRVPAEFEVNLTRGTFAVEADDPFEAGKMVSVRLTVNGSTATSDAIKVSTVTPLTVLSVDAVYGAAKIAVRMKPIARPAAKYSLDVAVADSQNFRYPLSADELMKGAADIPLQSPLLARDAYPVVTVTPQVLSKYGEARTVTAEPAGIRLKAPLTEGDTVITGSAHSSVKRVCVAVFGGGVTDADAKDPGDPAPVVRNCREAARRIYDGRVAAIQGKSTDQRFQALAAADIPEKRAALDEVSGPLLEEQEVTPDAKTGAFEFKLSRPLPAGASIFAREVLVDAPGGVQVALGGPDPVRVDSAGLDWGRVRGVFTVGASIGQTNNSFAKADPYVGFYLDGPFFNNLIAKYDKPDPKRARPRDLFGTKKFGISAHWLTAVRLTQTGTLTEIGGVTPGLQQAQSAVFMGGLYVPMRVSGMDWVYRGTQYSAYVAPLAKAGVTAVRDGVALGRTVTTVTTKIDPCPMGIDCIGTAKKEGPTEKFTRSNGTAPFAGLGVRLGVMSYEFMGATRRNRQVAPDPVMYLDLLWGPNQAYTSPGELVSRPPRDARNTATGTVTTTSVQSQNFTFESRFSVEARAKLPYIPAEIGVDVNQNWRRPVASLAGAPDDGGKIQYTDFRFIVGFRLDAAKTLFPIFAKKK